jgi:cellulose synthase (UDP-forming)
MMPAQISTPYDPPALGRGIDRFEAPPPLPQRLLVGLVALFSAVVLADLFLWLWHRQSSWGPRGLSFGLALVFLAVPLFHLVMMLWLALRFRTRRIPPPVRPYGVDVFVAATDEPLDLIEETLTAAVALRHPHRTWLLDDASREDSRQLAERLGAHYLRREGRDDLKAGNVNHALGQSDGEIIALFDIDHRPESDLLDRALGAFEDPRMGFVQVMLSARNTEESPVARAAAQTAYDYYNITAVGKDRFGGAGLMGSNALIRRTALEDIGGYRPGLAEDLETSVALHAAGWRSAYLREPLAPGLSPVDLPAFYKQQLKWARGVFEAGLRSLRGPFFRFDLGQKLCYLTRFTYYLLGTFVFLQLALLVLGLLWPGLRLEEISRRLLPLTVVGYLAKVVPLRLWALEREARRGFLFAGASLFASAWPVYLLATITAALRIEIPFLATPKTAAESTPAWCYVPQLVLSVLLLGALGYRAAHWGQAPMPVTAVLAVVGVGSQWMVPRALWFRG